MVTDSDESQIILVPQRSSTSIKVELEVSLAPFGISTNVWISLIKTILSVVIDPVDNIIIWLNHLREEIIIELDKSRARVRTEKLIQVTKIYEERKRSVERASWLDDDGKHRLIEKIDRALENHLEEIIQYG